MSANVEFEVAHANGVHRDRFDGAVKPLCGVVGDSTVCKHQHGKMRAASSGHWSAWTTFKGNLSQTQYVAKATKDNVTKLIRVKLRQYKFA